MDIKKAREIIGEINNQYTDAEVLNMIETARLFADIAIDMFSKMTPEERKKFKHKKQNECVVCDFFI